MAHPRFDFEQKYIEHGYIELNILPAAGNTVNYCISSLCTHRSNVSLLQFAMEPNVFHLWPRGEFTLIALANMDKTFTVTLFAPYQVAYYDTHSLQRQLCRSSNST